MKPTLTIAAIQGEVAAHYDHRVADLKSGRQHAALARVRQVGYYLAYELLGYSLARIGRAFGNRDHTTIRHGIRQIEELMGRDAVLDLGLAAIKARLAESYELPDPGAAAADNVADALATAACRAIAEVAAADPAAFMARVLALFPEAAPGPGAGP